MKDVWLSNLSTSDYSTHSESIIPSASQAQFYAIRPSNFKPKYNKHKNKEIEISAEALKITGLATSRLRLSMRFER